ncbi:uncharacterized protein N7529_004891 [Penicillium soppii]|uniref:uncharacterized protein n=1 Tax=Penicillium soppii TaxID=69789 RepID=UPI0025483168|nr:uncharacterized protein N7529_004891 [Penicillium soppii]KAJ5872538.1 hypothetical protein N7529_004891 [Penicillium soppii]
MTDSTSPIGIALLGGGLWAREEHAPAIEAASQCISLKAVYSRSAASARSIIENFAHPVDLYSEDSDNGFEDLLKRPDIEAVPVAENVEAAKELIQWYRTEIKGPTWTIAENWRFLKSYEFAVEKIKSLGKIIGFQGRQHGMISQNWKFNLTEWRRNPTHQGGYLLDGGVHYMAGLRLLLGAEPGKEIASLSALTNQTQPYLPPVDTADVIMRTTSGVTGVFQISRGTSLLTDELAIACSNGWIKLENETVTISRDGKVEVVTVPNERTGVLPEIRVWGSSIIEGKARPEQEPEAALADLELIELILKSGSRGGTPVICEHQNDV